MSMDGFSQKREDDAERKMEEKEQAHKDSAYAALKPLREYYHNHFEGVDMAIEAVLDHLLEQVDS